jgi:hypothetical protein
MGQLGRAAWLLQRRHAQFQDQERENDCKDAFAERLDSCLPQLSADKPGEKIHAPMPPHMRGIITCRHAKSKPALVRAMPAAYNHPMKRHPMLVALICTLAAAWLTVAPPGAAQESTGPLIADVRIVPAAGPTGTVYTVSVRIVSPRDPGAIVPVLHQIRERTERIDLPIHDDGLDGDAVKGDGVYSGRTSVPDSAAARTHHFEVYIVNTEGRKSNVLDYRFTVLPGHTT